MSLFLFVATFYFAFSRGRRTERAKFLALLPKADSINPNSVSMKPVASRCLLSVNGNSCPPNGEPISFENDFCVGKALLKTRTQPIDPRFVLQSVQDLYLINFKESLIIFEERTGCLSFSANSN